MKHLTLLLALTCCLAGAELGNKIPDSQPEASVNLMTGDGANLVRAQWRYSDTKIVEVDFTGPGADGQPTGKPVRTYDYSPHAGGVDYDDSRWEQISPESLDQRRSTGRLCFNWYRTSITIPEKIGTFSTLGSTVVFDTSVGRLRRSLGRRRTDQSCRAARRFYRGRMERFKSARYRSRCKTGSEDPACDLRREWPPVKSTDQLHLDAIGSTRLLQR